MADEGSNPPANNQPADNSAPKKQDNGSNPAGFQPAAHKKKRRRRRRKRPSSQQQAVSAGITGAGKPAEEPKKTTAAYDEIKIAGLDMEGAAKTDKAGTPPPPPPPPPPPKKEEETFVIPPEEETKEEEPMPAEEIPQEEIPEETPPQEEVKEVPEQPETPPPTEEEPSPFGKSLSPEEAATAPAGWDQLKQAIKEETATPKPMPVPPETGAVMGAAAAGAAAGVISGEVVKEDEPVKEKVKKVKEAKEKPVLSQEELEERKEIFRIISRYALGGCAVIAVLVGLFFFNLPQRAFDAIKGFFMPTSTQQIQTSDEETVIPTGDFVENSGSKTSILTGQNKATNKEEFVEGVGTALVTGTDVPKERQPTSAVATAFMIGKKGEQELIQDRIASYMMVLTKLQNAFKTDIDELLSKSPDREIALEAHIKDLTYIQTDALETLQEIKERRDEIKVEFNQVATLKDQLEEDFFNTMDKLEGTDANDILNEFIDVSKRYTALKAEYSALDKTQKLFETATSNMEARIRDIEFNRTALIKGVKVIDIKGSDLELIIEESEL